MREFLTIFEDLWKLKSVELTVCLEIHTVIMLEEVSITNSIAVMCDHVAGFDCVGSLVFGQLQYISFEAINESTPNCKSLFLQPSPLHL